MPHPLHRRSTHPSAPAERPAWHGPLRQLAIAALLAAGASLSLVGCGEESPNERAGGAAAPGASSASSEADSAKADEGVEALSHDLHALLDAGGGDLQPLLKEAAELTRRHPNHAQSRSIYGHILLLSKQPEKALEQLRRALEINPDQPEVQLIAGTTAMKIEGPQQAEHHYAQAVSLEPTEPRYRLHLAKAYMDQKRYDRARQQLLDALQINSDLDKAYYELSNLYAQQNKLGPALDQIQRALDLVSEDQPDRRQVYIRRRAALLRRANEPGDALAVLRELPPKVQFEPAVMEDLAACWAMLGQPEKAAAHYEQAALVYRTSEEVLATAAHWYLQAEDLDGAQNAIDRLRRLNAGSDALPDLTDRLQKIRSDGS